MAGSSKESEMREKIVKEVKEKGVEFLTFEFVDILGTAKNCEYPIYRLEEVMNEGVWFDGSSIEGFTRIYESDMFLKPDLSTFGVIPWTGNKVARMICDVYTDEKTPFAGDPRNVLKKQLEKASEMNFEFKVGPELEFFLFKDSEQNGNTPKMEAHDQAGYFDLAFSDKATELRREMVPALQSMGLTVEMAHHECAPGQHEIDFKYGTALNIADQVMTYKTAVKTVSQKYGLYASFMPKPLFGVNGSGMHVHQSLWKNGKNAFYEEGGEFHLSKLARQFIAGQLHHARAMSAVLAPCVNSYKRLVPGYEAPVYVCWGQTNRSALIRIPRYQEGKTAATRIELRCPDPSSNPYLVFSVMLAAGLDGIKKGMEPPKPVDESVYHFDEQKLRDKYIGTLPGSLGDAVSELEKDSVIREALGKHADEKLREAQKDQWDRYRIQVTPWELEEYYRRY